MEDFDVFPLIYRGCKLARELETNLPNFANPVCDLSSSCDEIIEIFSTIKNRLSNNNDMSLLQEELEQPATMSFLQLQHREQMVGPSSQPATLSFREPRQIDVAGVEGWFRSSSMFDHMGLSGSYKELPEMGGGRGEEFRQSADALLDSVTNPSSQTARRSSSRKNEVNRRTVRLAAPRIGNTEISLNDGFTWKKYGQKEILGSSFPRGYYRCTHQKLSQCPAKKQVQRLDNDTFEVTYRGDHTCILSSTAPSDPPVPLHKQQVLHQHSTVTSPTIAPMETWLSMDIRPLNQFMDDQQMQAYHDFDQSGRMVGSTSSSVGISAVRFGGHGGDYQLPVADMADVMFNSGSSSNNSMDLIFSSNMEEKQ